MAKFFISTNQILQAEVNRADELVCNGVHFIAENSPDVINWKPILRMNDTLFITEEGGIDRNWLFQAPTYPPPPRISVNVKIAEAAGLRVDSSLVYVEYPRTMLDSADIGLAAQTLGYPVMLLSRSFTDYQDTKNLVRQAIKRPDVRGIIFELNPSSENVQNTNIRRGIREVLDANKQCSVLLPPYPGTSRYEYAIKSAVTELMKSGDFTSSRLSIILAVYDRPYTGVSFLGRRNSVRAALRWLNNNAR